MNWRSCIGLLCVVLFLGGCSLNTDEKVFNKVHQRLTGMESYSCIAEVYVKGNKNPGEFKVKQWFEVPNRYRIEVIDPGCMKDKTTVFDGNRIWMYYPYIDQVFLMENVDISGEENLFVGFFLRDLMESEEIQYYTVEKDGEQVIVIELPVPGSSKYRFIQKLYVNKKHLVPMLLEVYDVNNNITMRVKYSDFTYNPELNPDFFHQATVKESILYDELDTAQLFLDSLEDARPALDFSPLELTSTPQGFEQDYIQVIDSDKGKVLIIKYKGEEEGFTILQKLFYVEEGKYCPEGEILDVEGRNAIYSEDLHTREICWREGNIDIQVMGTISKKTLLEIAKKTR